MIERREGIYSWCKRSLAGLNGRFYTMEGSIQWKVLYKWWMDLVIALVTILESSLEPDAMVDQLSHCSGHYSYLRL